MNPARIAIDRLDLAFEGLDRRTAEAVQQHLPGALQRELSRRLARLGAGGVQALSLAGADLGTLDLPPRADARRAADAIAARLADWLHATTTTTSTTAGS